MCEGRQEKLFPNPWGVNLGYEGLRDQLNELIPLNGACENPRSTNKNLDQFRRAQNAVHDFFNNGLINKRGLFKQIFGPHLKRDVPTVRCFDYFSRVSWSQWEDDIEEVFTPFILAAAKEQGITVKS